MINKLDLLGEYILEELKLLKRKPHLKNLIKRNIQVASWDKANTREYFTGMISEAALTGKPIYIASILPRKNDKRFQSFRNLFRELNITRNLGEEVENWNYQKLDETNRVANIIKQKINS